MMSAFSRSIDWTHLDKSRPASVACALSPIRPVVQISAWHFVMFVKPFKAAGTVSVKNFLTYTGSSSFVSCAALHFTRYTSSPLPRCPITSTSRFVSLNGTVSPSSTLSQPFAHNNNAVKTSKPIERKSVAAVIDDLRPGLARTILALSKRQILLRADAQRLLAAPLQPKSSRTPTYGAEVDTLVALRLCSVEGSNTALERLTIKSLAGLPISHQLARSERVRQIVDRHLTRMITDQLRKQGVIGWNSATLADLETGSVRFSDYVFSAFGYSWLDPLVRRAVGQRPKPVPVLFDVCARECDVHDVQFGPYRFQSERPHVGAGSNSCVRVY